MKKLTIVAFVLLMSTMTFAQEKAKFGIKFSGFVKSDIIFDSRQTVTAREGHFLLYPMSADLDQYGKDINGKSNFNMLSIQSRLKGVITGPDAFGAKTSALIEGAFFGHTNEDVNGFRLRHAYAKLNWETTELLVGQYWHAMFITSCFPGTISFNTGVPFQPFSRNPQIRLTQKAEKFKFIFTAMSQRDFASTGPDGGSSKYLRNNVMPELNFTLQYEGKCAKGNSYLFGAGVDYLSLTPRIKTEGGSATEKAVNGFSIMAFMKIVAGNITWKAEAICGQNTTHLLMLGGYAESKIIDPVTIEKAYEPVKTLSLWTDIHTNGKKFQAGLFAGYTKNKGIDGDRLAGGKIYSRGVSRDYLSSIDYVYRISPRLVFNSGKMRFAGEIEYTVAGYGETQSNLTVADAKSVKNLRLLIGVYYFF
jgi:hypothetical protein